jgi:hypothetical protein
MRRVAQVLQIELPVSFIDVLEGAAGDSPSGARSIMSSSDVCI